MRIPTEGLIIKEQDLQERDKLVTVLTKTHGTITAFAKGAKNIKTSKCAAVSLLCFSSFDLYQHKESYIIGDARPIQMFIKLRNDIKKMSLAQYFCELALNLTHANCDNSIYLKNILNALHLLCEDKKDELLIKSCVEMNFISMSGFMPDLVMCKHCGMYENANSGFVFVAEHGILLCDACFKHSNYVHNNTAFFLDISTLTALRHIIYTSPDKLFSFSLPKEKLILLNKVTENYVKFMSGKEFKTLQFYNSL